MATAIYGNVSLDLLQKIYYGLSMAWLSSDRLTELQADLDAIELHITAIRTAINNGAASDISEYRLDTGAGSQRVRYRNLDDMLNALDRLIARRDWIWRKLNGLNVQTLNLRRKPLT